MELPKCIHPIVFQRNQFDLEIYITLVTIIRLPIHFSGSSTLDPSNIIQARSYWDWDGETPLLKLVRIFIKIFLLKVILNLDHFPAMSAIVQQMWLYFQKSKLWYPQYILLEFGFQKILYSYVCNNNCIQLFYSL